MKVDVPELPGYKGLAPLLGFASAVTRAHGEVSKLAEIDAGPAIAPVGTRIIASRV